LSIQTIARAVRLTIRSEVLVAEIRLLTYARKLMLACLALLAAFIGFAFVNVALFEFLQSLWGPMMAPLVIGLGNIVFAGVIVVAAKMVKPGSELAMAEEMRNLSESALESEFRPNHINGGMLGSLAAARDGNLVKLLVPVVVSIISSMRRSKEPSKK
jgi:hypothetical protein